MPTAEMGGTAEFHLAQTDRLLTTTRAVRKRLDLERRVEREVIQECIRIAIQAPTGGWYAQQWRWLVVTDTVKRARLAGVRPQDQADQPPERSLASHANNDSSREFRAVTTLDMSTS